MLNLLTAPSGVYLVALCVTVYGKQNKHCVMLSTVAEEHAPFGKLIDNHSAMKPVYLEEKDHEDQKSAKMAWKTFVGQRQSQSTPPHQQPPRDCPPSLPSSHPPPPHLPFHDVVQPTSSPVCADLCLLPSGRGWCPAQREAPNHRTAPPRQWQQSQTVEQAASEWRWQSLEMPRPSEIAREVCAPPIDFCGTSMQNQ